MTDLEITRLCAQAMFTALEWEQRLFDYDPLHDDAQAMALVKKFRPACIPVGTDSWEVGTSPRGPFGSWNANDLTRAVCLCVAKMAQAKAAA